MQKPRTPEEERSRRIEYWLVENLLKPAVAAAMAAGVEWAETVTISFPSKDGLTCSVTQKGVKIADLRQLINEMEAERGAP